MLTGSAVWALSAGAARYPFDQWAHPIRDKTCSLNASELRIEIIPSSASPPGTTQAWCANGILDGRACCPAACGQCGGGGCGSAPGGREQCCSGRVLNFAPACRLGRVRAHACVSADCGGGCDYVVCDWIRLVSIISA